VRKRSSADIIAGILDSANGGIGKTRLLTKANLTSTQLKRYIDLLLEKKLVAQCKDRSNGHPTYKTTGLGLQYLALYSSVKSVAYINA
jgi:predicted transcriptional regulator